MPSLVPKSLVVFLEDWGWSRLEERLAGSALPFVAGLAGQGRAGPLVAGPMSRFPWSRLLARGLRLGLFNPPGLARPRPLSGFMVCRRRGGNGDFTHPPELAQDLADYPPAPSWTWQDGLAGLSRGRRDSLFAEQALYSRLGLEQCRRLFRRFAVDVALVGWRGPGVMRRLFPERQKRRGIYLAQLDRHIHQLVQDLEPGLVLVLGLDPGDGPHGLVAWEQGGAGRRRELPASWDQVLDMIPEGAGEGAEA